MRCGSAVQCASARMKADAVVRFGPSPLVRLSCSAVLLWPCPAALPRRAATSMRTPIRSAPTRSSARRTSHTPTPQDNIFATTPGLEQQARRSTVHHQWSGADLLQFQSHGADLGRRPTDQNSAEFSPVRRRLVVDTGASTCRSASRRMCAPSSIASPSFPACRLRQAGGIGPPAVRRPSQRPGLFALHRLFAAIGLHAVLSATGSTPART